MSKRIRIFALGTAVGLTISTLGVAMAQQVQPQLGGQQQPLPGQQLPGQPPQMQQPGQQLQIPGQQRQPGLQQQLQQQQQRQQVLPGQQRRQPGTLAIAGIFDVATANFAVLNEALADPQLLNRLVRGGGPRVGQQAQQQQQQGQVRVVFLGNRLDPQQRQQVRQTLSASNYIQRNAALVQTIIRQNPALQQAVQRNNVRLNQVVALDVIGQPPTIYVLSARQQGQPTQQPGPMGQQQPGQTQQQQRQGQQAQQQGGQAGQQQGQQGGR